MIKIVMMGLLFSLGAQAKDLTQRLGTGVKNLAGASSELAVHYYPTRDYTWVGGLAVDTQSQQSSTMIKAGLRRHLLSESQLNFFVGGTMSFLSQENNGQATSGFALAATTGVEFFFAGLENLGFQVESGVEISSLGSSRFRTIGGNFVQSGVVFYF